MKNPLIRNILLVTAVILLVEGIVFGFLLMRRLSSSQPVMQAMAADAEQEEETSEQPEAPGKPLHDPGRCPRGAGGVRRTGLRPEGELSPSPWWATAPWATDAMSYGGEGTFVYVVGDNYDYPFDNVRYLFEDDDFTIVNLECNLTDVATVSDKMFAFRGPTAYTNILTGSSVEFVSYANNHRYDYGYEGYDETIAALEDAGLAYCLRNDAVLYETESGLKVGVYAGYFEFDEADMRADIQSLRDQGADVVIASLHWGDEGTYRPLEDQKYLGRAAIDAGADIVYGHHPHVLQPMEEYGDGIIFYSVGNFSFGGNTNPRDKDTVIVPAGDHPGEARCGWARRSSSPAASAAPPDYNTYQPTLYEEGTEEYERVLSKLDGTFEGDDLTIDYSGVSGWG